MLHNSINMRDNHSLSTLEVEIEPNHQTKCQKCLILCGTESRIISLTYIGIGAGHFYIFYKYSYDFTIGFQQRDYIWVFFALATFSWLLVVYILIRTCSAVFLSVRSSKEASKVADNQHENDDDDQEASLNKLKAYTVALYKNIFNINGKYFLIKISKSIFGTYIKDP